jgi:hypothetical protein
LTFICRHVFLPSTQETYIRYSVNIDSSAGITVFYVFPKCPHKIVSITVTFQSMILQRGFLRFDVDDRTVHIYTHITVVQQILCYWSTHGIISHRGAIYQIRHMLTFLEALCFHHVECVFWIKVSVCEGKGLFLVIVGIFFKKYSVVQCLWYRISQHICANMYAYIIFNSLFLQVIYMMCAQIYPEEKGTTFFELCVPSDVA